MGVVNSAPANKVKSSSVSITWLLTIWQEVFMVFMSKGFAPQTEALRCDYQEANVKAFWLFPPFSQAPAVLKLSQDLPNILSPLHYPLRVRSKIQEKHS